MRTVLIASIVAAAACLAGCANYTDPVGTAPATTPGERGFENLWQASVHVLGRYDFRLARQDRRAGVIVTEPMTGEYAGEFWRKDAATRQDLAEGTIQTVYRQATVRLEPVSEGAEQFRLAVEVQTFRSNRSHPQVTSTSEAMSLFRFPGSSGERSRDGEELDGAGDYMVPLGRDKELEAHLAADIRAAAGV